MIKVGITGGIGSGKTAVCRVFELLDISIYYADSEAKQLMDNEVIKAQVVDLFGTAVLTATDTIDRKLIAELVFKNKKLLEQLNVIIHPAVSKHFLEWCKGKINELYILKEAAILFESSSSKECDRIITVTSPLELKISRVMQRDDVSAEKVIERIKNQTDDDYKIKHSDYVIMNDERELLIPQVIRIHELLISENKMH